MQQLVESPEKMLNGAGETSVANERKAEREGICLFVDRVVQQHEEQSRIGVSRRKRAAW